jgi:hypothetical protein
VANLKYAQIAQVQVTYLSGRLLYITLKITATNVGRWVKLRATLRSVPQGNMLKITERHVLRSFSYLKESWDFFHFLEIVTDWLVPSAGQKIPVQPGWYLPPLKNPLVEKHVCFT